MVLDFYPWLFVAIGVLPTGSETLRACRAWLRTGRHGTRSGHGADGGRSYRADADADASARARARAEERIDSPGSWGGGSFAALRPPVGRLVGGHLENLGGGA